jgi:hypothetical protein
MVMTDRELIELAAKAEGRQIAWDARGAYTVVDGISGGNVWNPIESDADAFRLAVKLRIKIWGVTADGRESSCLMPIHGQVIEPVLGDDALAATRRAITRAAAEIGKAMESAK